MKISSTELTSMLSVKPASAQATVSAKRSAQVKRCGRDVARVKELNCMAAVAKFGHLRIIELARAVWPTAKFGEQVAGRTVQRLVEQGLLLERRNALGSRSLCLTRVGQACPVKAKRLPHRG